MKDILLNARALPEDVRYLDDVPIENIMGKAIDKMYRTYCRAVRKNYLIMIHCQYFNLLFEYSVKGI